jgi:hypothetical protein
MEINHVECQTDEDVYNFRADFEEGVFIDEIEESLAHVWPAWQRQEHLGKTAAE